MTNPDFDVPPMPEPIEPDLEPGASDADTQGNHRNLLVRPHLTRISDIEKERHTFLWAGMIPLGTHTIFVGRGAAGKGTFWAWLCAQLTHGVLEGEDYGKPGNVLIVAANEDSFGAIVRPKLEAAGADITKITRLLADDGRGVENLRLPAHIPVIEDAINQTGARLVIIDPAASIFSGNLDKREDVRMSLDPLAGVAERTGAAMLIVHHQSKGRGNARDKASGSVAWDDAARSHLSIATDPENENERIITQEKSSYGKLQGSFKFVISGEQILFDDGQNAEYPKATFLGASDKSVQDVINATYDDSESASDDLVEWLTEWLENAGEILGTDIEKGAIKQGYAWRTVQRKLTNIGTFRREGFGSDSKTWWRLKAAPLDDLEPANMATRATRATRATQNNVAPLAPLDDLEPANMSKPNAEPEPATVAHTDSARPVCFDCDKPMTKNGKNRSGSSHYRCKNCGKTKSIWENDNLESFNNEQPHLSDDNNAPPGSYSVRNNAKGCQFANCKNLAEPNSDNCQWHTV